jgi:hypothetical protein
MGHGKFLEIVIDKGILAVVLALFGFWLNYSLETYKGEQQKALESFKRRNDAIQAISAACAEMNSLFFTYTRKDRNPSAEDVKRYEAAIDKVVTAHNNFHAILSDPFSDALQRYLWVHDGFRKKGVANCFDYRDFAEDLYHQYGLWCQVELGNLQKLPEHEYRLLDWDFSTVNSKGTDKYLSENFEEWKHWRRQREKK